MYYCIVSYIFIGWLKKATDVQSNMNDLKEAYCSYCNVVLRAHHNDLVDHSKTAKHVSKKNSLNIKKQPTLNSFGWYRNNYYYYLLLIFKGLIFIYIMNL